MPYAKLRSDILAARDERQRALEQLAGGDCRTLILLSLNLPGRDKPITSFSPLFSWGEQQLKYHIEDLEPVTRQTDILGPWALYAGSLTAAAAKQIGCMIEESCAAARLLDIDVYNNNAAPYHRQQLGLPPRPCFVCAAPATECIRLGRHSSQELQRYLECLLDHLPA
ncbi:MAG: citrate lyase holo-[acyl-carrier protein] synthase [Pelovirga sp.]